MSHEVMKKNAVILSRNINNLSNEIKKSLYIIIGFIHGLDRLPQ